MAIRQFNGADVDAVVELWEACGLTRSWNDPRKDIARKLDVQPELFLVMEQDARVAGTAMVGFDGHRGWVNYLAVHPDFRSRGFGRELMQRAEALLLGLGCPKINLQVRAGNEAVLGFYRNLGYAEDPVASMGKRLIPDS